MILATAGASFCTGSVGFPDGAVLLADPQPPHHLWDVPEWPPCVLVVDDEHLVVETIAAALDEEYSVSTPELSPTLSTNSAKLSARLR